MMPLLLKEVMNHAKDLMSADDRPPYCQLWNPGRR